MADGTMHTLEHDEKREEHAVREEAAREPVKSPESVVHAAAEPANKNDVALPEVKEKTGILARIEGKIKQWRRHAIGATPSFVVNNSSNILGASHVLTEVAMFKASMAKNENFHLVKDKSNPISYIKDPITQTWAGTLENARSYTKLSEIFKGDPNKGFFGNAMRYVTDTHAADARENARQLEAKALIAKHGANAPKWTKSPAVFGNRWQTRSTLAGLIVWTLSVIIPDGKEDPEEVERMAELEQTNMFKYIGERVRQAVWVPEWREHKRQMIGLGVMASGVFSLLGSWRVRKVVDGVTHYNRDTSYLATSLFTLGSGTALTFSLDDERGFARFGMGMMGRLLFLPKSIMNRFENKDPGRYWYAGATASFQAENMAQSLIGGAEKNADGSIIDHAAIRQEAKMKAAIKVAAKKAGEPVTDEEIEARIKRAREAKEAKAAPKDETPSNLVSQPVEKAMAMPERVTAHAEQAQA